MVVVVVVVMVMVITMPKSHVVVGDDQVRWTATVPGARWSATAMARSVATWVAVVDGGGGGLGNTTR